MALNKKILASSLTGAIGSMLLAAGTATVQAGDQAPGYVQESAGDITRTGSGDCLHTGTWKPEMANIVGCDGYVIDAKVEVIEGAPSGLVSAVVIPAAALFAFDSADLSDDGKRAIEEYRTKLRPEFSDAYAGIVIGHTDSTGDENYNVDLSKRRAQAVNDYLVSTGAPADKLRVVGRGEAEPIASNDTPEGQAQNRRVEIVVIGEPRALDTLRFPSVALFPRRSAELTEQGKELVEKHRQDAREQLSRASYIEVIGHTDDVGDDDYNMKLSQQRAEAMRDYLVGTGLDPNKIVTVGAGETRPIASNKTPEGRAENRRVEVLVLGRVRQ
jgi:outer membrane protein OmpA-like peptidoglycan-associated protein